MNDATRAGLSVRVMMAREAGFNNKRRALKPVVPEILTAGTPLWRWDGVSSNDIYIYIELIVCHQYWVSRLSGQR